MSPPRVLAIVVHYRDPEMTARCLRSLRGAEGWQFHVAVVEQSDANRDADRLWDVLRENAKEYNSHLVRNKANLGFAGGCNAACAALVDPVQGRNYDFDFVWLVNPDVQAEPAALAALLARARSDAQLAAIASDLGPHDIPTGKLHLWRGLARPIPTNTPDFLSAASLLLRADVFREEKYLDDRFFLYWEDVDLCLRLARRGWKLAYEPASKVRHERGASVGNKSPVQDYYATRASLLAVRKHCAPILPIAAIFVAWRSLAAKLARGEWPRFRASLKGWADGLAGISGRCDL